MPSRYFTHVNYSVFNSHIKAVANAKTDLMLVIFLQKLPKKMKNGKQTFIPNL